MTSIVFELMGCGRRVFGPDVWADADFRNEFKSRAMRLGKRLKALASMADGPQKVDRIGRLLLSYDARICSVVIAWSKKSARLGVEEAKNLASRLHPWASLDEPIYLRWERKAKGGYRPIFSFGPRRRALQMLARLVLKALWGENEFEFARRGRGREAAMRRILSTMDTSGGPRWIVTGDVKNCFASFDKEKIKTLIPMPKRVIENCVLIPDDAKIICKQYPENTSEKAARGGLPQGSLASSFIASKLLQPVLTALNGPIVVGHADDVFVACPTEAEARENEHVLIDFSKNHPAGPLIMKTKVSRIGQPNDFLGYTMRNRPKVFGGGVRVTPSNRAFDTLERRFLDKYVSAPEAKLDDVVEKYIWQWANSHASWDRSERGDDLLWINLHAHWLTGAKALRAKSTQ